MTRWDLNAVVLCHCQRYFGAVTTVVQAWEDAGLHDLGQLVATMGNLAWARAGYVGLGRGPEEALSVAGAMAGTWGGELVGASGDLRQRALAVIAAEERHVWANLDPILDTLAAELGTRMMKPGELDRWVWERLFPQYPWGLGLSELQEAIRQRLAPAMAPACGR